VKVEKEFMLNCGPHKIFCHDKATLEFIESCILIADGMEGELTERHLTPKTKVLQAVKYETTVPSPNTTEHP
jgi:hypothetical protein